MACEHSIRRGLHGEYKGEYIPRWIKQKNSNVDVYQVVPNVVVCLLI